MACCFNPPVTGNEVHQRGRVLCRARRGCRETGGHMTVDFKNHTVEKIGGTSMSRRRRTARPALQGRPSPITTASSSSPPSAASPTCCWNTRRSGEPGVYAAVRQRDRGAMAGCRRADPGRRGDARGARAPCSSTRPTTQDADDFVRERIEGARTCLIDLQRLCSYGHFRLSQHMADDARAALGPGRGAFGLRDHACCCAATASTRASWISRAGATTA